MRTVLIIMSFVLTFFGAIAMLASSFSSHEMLFVKGALVWIMGTQIQQDKEIWQ